MKSKSTGGDEEILWVLQKDGRTAEARTGTLANSGGQPELRIYTRHSDKEKFNLLFAQVVKDARAAGALALEKRHEFVAQGWIGP